MRLITSSEFGGNISMDDDVTNSFPSLYTFLSDLLWGGVFEPFTGLRLTMTYRSSAEGNSLY